jgi:hypothetical protein
VAGFREAVDIEALDGHVALKRRSAERWLMFNWAASGVCFLFLAPIIYLSILALASVNGSAGTGLDLRVLLPLAVVPAGALANFLTTICRIYECLDHLDSCSEAFQSGRHRAAASFYNSAPCTTTEAVTKEDRSLVSIATKALNVAG